MSFVTAVLDCTGALGQALSSHLHKRPKDTMAMQRRTHLQRLESESIDIIREVAASFRNPVMLYSIGKDSSVMLHLARKAFHPSRPPFPLLHVDTTWKFREMIKFRDEAAKDAGMDLDLVHTNQDGKARGINPFDHGSALYTQVMKTDVSEAGAGPLQVRRRVRRGAPR